MIRSFADDTHAVVTGVAIVDSAGEPTVFHDTATVTLRGLSDAAIDAYLDTDAWRGKAGGYNLFDRQGAGWPITVTGDPATVVGLPMRLLTAALRHRGVVPRAGKKVSDTVST